MLLSFLTWFSDLCILLIKESFEPFVLSFIIFMHHLLFGTLCCLLSYMLLKSSIINNYSLVHSLVWSFFFFPSHFLFVRSHLRSSSCDIFLLFTRSFVRLLLLFDSSVYVLRKVFIVFDRLIFTKPLLTIPHNVYFHFVAHHLTPFR